MADPKVSLHNRFHYMERISTMHNTFIKKSGSILCSLKPLNNSSVQYEIDDQLKDRVKLAVSRSTHAAKLRDFRKWMDAVKKDTIHRVCISIVIVGIIIIQYSYAGQT